MLETAWLKWNDLNLHKWPESISSVFLYGCFFSACSLKAATVPNHSSAAWQQPAALPYLPSVCLSGKPPSLGEPCGPCHAPLTLFCGCCCCCTCWSPSDHPSRVSDENDSLSGHTPCRRLFVWPLLLPHGCICAQNICKSVQQHSSSVLWRIILSVSLDDWAPYWNRANPGAPVGASPCSELQPVMLPGTRWSKETRTPKIDTSSPRLPPRIQNSEPQSSEQYSWDKGRDGGVEVRMKWRRDNGGCQAP